MQSGNVPLLATQGGVVIVGAEGANERELGHGQFRPSIAVAGDKYMFVFGAIPSRSGRSRRSPPARSRATSSGCRPSSSARRISSCSPCTRPRSPLPASTRCAWAGGSASPMKFYDGEVSEAKVRDVVVHLTGTGAANPVTNYGQACTITRLAVGRYKIAFREWMGLFVGLVGFAFGATTPGDVKGQTITYGDFDATNQAIEIDVWSSVFAADDLQLTEKLDVTLRFKATTA
jgi:hypothetical protein